MTYNSWEVARWPCCRDGGKVGQVEASISHRQVDVWKLWKPESVKVAKRRGRKSQEKPNAIPGRQCQADTVSHVTLAGSTSWCGECDVA